MKNRLVLSILLLAGLVPLSGCSSMLERSYLVVSPHAEHPVTADDSNVLQAETYQDLVNDVLYFVNQGMETGVIRLTNYPRDVETDLNNACLEVAKDAPLGAYAVDYIEHDCTRVVKYYESTIHITYRRTLEQIQSIKNVTGSSAIRQVLLEQLSLFSPEVVLQVAYFTEDEAHISHLIQQAYYDAPAVAFGMPEYTVTLYPQESSQERIVEILLTYPAPVDQLRQKSQSLLRQADLLADTLGELSGAQGGRAVHVLLRQQVTDAPAGTASTAYDALVEHQADSEGMALAFQLLCDRTGLESRVVQGVKDGAPHFWNVLTLSPGQYAHVDAYDEEVLLLSDAALEALGYTWDRNEIPPCL